MASWPELVIILSAMLFGPHKHCCEKGLQKQLTKGFCYYDPFGNIKGDAQDLGISIELVPLSKPDDDFNVSTFYVDLLRLEGNDLAEVKALAAERSLYVFFAFPQCEASLMSSFFYQGLSLGSIQSLTSYKGGEIILLFRYWCSASGASKIFSDLQKRLSRRKSSSNFHLLHFSN
ncbi:hypothetical protein C2S51_016972 [Perilla frutescens var. frutescens]|nr:hypothetical protein C2S51_016972 [Perilla frutescens var. frutescens]